MTERELLELAALAGGIDIVRWDRNGTEPVIILRGFGHFWNPFHDGDDVIFLATRVGPKIWKYMQDMPEDLSAGLPVPDWYTEELKAEYATARSIIYAAAMAGKDLILPESAD